MKPSEPFDLYSPLSISKKLWPWCLWAICILTVAWTGLIAWNEVSGQKYAGILETTIAVASNTADVVPLIIVYSILGVMIGNFILGGGIMIMARVARDYLYDKIERQREKFREEGRQALTVEVAEWNRKRLEAEERGEQFDEPPPGV